MGFEQPIATVDVALFTLREGELCVLLNRREKPPYQDTWALPGGFVHVQEDEDLTGTARRVLREKTRAKVAYLEQLYTFSGAARDPRGWSISVSYYALVPLHALGEVDNTHAMLAPVSSLPSLPFDHSAIIGTAVDRLRNKSSYSSLPTYLLPTTFTLAELKKVYEQVMGGALDRTSFRRNMLAQEVIEPVEGATRGGAHRPAQLYRRKSDQLQQFARVL